MNLIISNTENFINQKYEETVLRQRIQILNQTDKFKEHLLEKNNLKVKKYFRKILLFSKQWNYDDRCCFYKISS